MEIRIYVANLAEYVAGNLVGEWVELPNSNLSEVLDRISRGGREELAIHDYEAPFEIGEYDDIQHLNELAERIAGVSEDLFEAIEDATGYKVEDVLQIIEDGSYMTYEKVDSMADVAYEMVEDGTFGNIEGPLQNYIDYEKLGRDLEIDGWHYHSKTNIAVRVD